MMNEVMTICGVECYEKDGTAYLKLESVARGLGFTRIANSGNEVVRWETVRKYLAELGVPTCWHEDFKPVGKDGLPDFIPENIFYRLAMKAKNETAEKFQALVADEIIPSIRRTGSYTYGKKLTALEQLQLQRKAILEVNEKVDAVQKELEEFKNDMPLFGVETDKITNAVKAKGIEVLGGKNSNAYNDNSLRTKVYQDIHGEVKRQFGVNTYKAIKRNQCDKAIELVKTYEPPMYLKEQIYNTNAQMRIA